MTTLLSATSLALLRGERLLFRDLHFALNAGEALLIEGANGSGKTSLLRLIAGLLEAEDGEICWRGRNIRQQRQDYASELVWYGHLSGCKRDLTLLENLRCEVALRPASKVAMAEVVNRLGLQDLTDLPMRSLSAGQQRRVALARLLLSAAPLWLLDEPFTNLDREGQQLVREMLAEHLASGGLCAMASHQGVELAFPLQRLALS